MADNFTVKDAANANLTIGSDDVGGVHYPKGVSVGSDGNPIFGTTADAKATATDTTPVTAMAVWKQISASVQAMVTGVVLADGNAIVGRVGGISTTVSATFTRPADTTPYTAGDMVANSATAGSVTKMSFSVARATGLGALIRGATLRKSGTSATNAYFRLWLFKTDPTVDAASGDNLAFLTNNSANVIGAIDFVVDMACSDGVVGRGVPRVGSEIVCTTDTVYGLLQALAGYTPANAEVFAIDLSLLQN